MSKKLRTARGAPTHWDNGDVLSEDPFLKDVCLLEVKSLRSKYKHAFKFH